MLNATRTTDHASLQTSNNYTLTKHHLTLPSRPTCPEEWLNSINFVHSRSSSNNLSIFSFKTTVFKRFSQTNSSCLHANKYIIFQPSTNTVVTDDKAFQGRFRDDCRAVRQGASGFYPEAFLLYLRESVPQSGERPK